MALGWLRRRNLRGVLPVVHLGESVTDEQIKELRAKLTEQLGPVRCPHCDGDRWELEITHVDPLLVNLTCLNPECTLNKEER